MLLEHIVESPRNLILLETTQAEDFVAQLRQLARRSGQALYLWTPDTGLMSLRDGDVQVQGSRRLADTLRFIRRSMHFGIYLVAAENVLLTPQVNILLAQIGRLHDEPSRRVVLYAEQLEVSDVLENLSLRLGISNSNQAQPRLRDGRWVR